MNWIASKIGAFALALLVVSNATVAQTPPPELLLGRDWLVAQIGPTGEIDHTTVSMATPRQLRAEVLETLLRLGNRPAGLVSRVAGENSSTEVEHVARELVALARSGGSFTASLNHLRGFQNADGGFGGEAGKSSSVLDTSLALLAFRSAGLTQGNDIARAVDFLVQSVNAPASIAWRPTATSSPYVDAYRVLALQSYAPAYAIGEPLTAARQGLLAQRVNQHYLETLLDAVSAIALGFGTTSNGEVDALRAQIIAAQSPNGSWSDDPFLTALAVRALDSGSNAPSPTSGRLTARIRDRATSEPLGGALIEMTGAATPYSSTSAADGSVLIEDIAPQNYSVHIARAGYDAVDLTSIAIVAGVSSDLGIVLLDRAADRAALVGQVTDVTSGNPVAGASVAISGAVSGNVSTDPSGRYEFIAETAGVVDVVISRSGYQSASGNGTLTLGTATRFSPALYPDGVGVPTTSILIGQVVDSVTGSELSGATITIDADDTQSGVDGRFELTNLDIGAFSGSISKSGYQTLIVNGTLAPGVNDAGVIRLLSSASNTTSSLSGFVRDAQSSQAIANAVVAVQGTSLQSVTDANGHYRIDAIAAVPFTASASAPGYAAASISSGENGHSNFEADFALDRLAASEVVMEGVAMNAPEYDPFSEVGVIATVRNNGTTEAGLIFNALIMDSTQHVVRDVPAIQRTFGMPLEATIQRIPAGQTLPITITWPNLDDLPGDYSVLVRGVSAQGQVMVEGGATYRQLALVRLGGSVVTDPPVLQAGTGQSVSITGHLVNMGNMPIAAGDARLDITLVAGDNRPPLPPPAEVATDLFAGAPLNGPLGVVSDDDGNLYTVNKTNRQLIRIAPDRTTTAVLATIPQYTTGTPPQWLGYPVGIGILPSGNLRIVGSAGSWVADVALSEPHGITYTQIPSSANTAYLVDTAGNEYFAGSYLAQASVLRRTPGGVISVLATAGFTAPANAAVSPDGNLYVALTASHRIMRVNAESGTMDTFTNDAGSPTGIAFDAAGKLHTVDSVSGDLRKYDALGASTPVTGGLQNAVDLQLGRDGNFYVLISNGSIWRIDATGQKWLFANGPANNFSYLSMDVAGGVYFSNLRDAFYRGVEQLPMNRYSAFSITGIAARADGSAWVTDSGRLLSVAASGVATVHFDQSLTSLNTIYSDTHGTLISVGRRDAISGATNASIDTFENGTLTTLYRPPFVSAAPKMLAMPDSSVITLSNATLSKVNRDGTTQVVSTLRSGQFMGLRSNGHVAIFDNYDKLISIDPTTGIKTTLGNANAFLTGLGQSPNPDELVYVESNGRTLHRFTISTAADNVIATLPTGNTPNHLVARPAFNDVLISTSGQRLFRWDGTAITDLGYSDIAALFPDEAGNAVVRRSDKLYWLDATGALGPARVLPSAFIPTTAFSNRDIAQVDSYRINFFSDGNALIGRAEAIAVFTSFGRYGNGDIAIFDNTTKRILRWNGSVLSALPGGFNDVVAMTSHNGEIFVTRSGGVHRIGDDGTSTLVYAHPGWNAGEYGYLTFQPNGDRMAVSSAWTYEIAIVESGTRLDGFMQLASGRAIAQRTDGSWWLQAGSHLIRLAADGIESEIVSRTSGIQDLSIDAQGRVLAITGTQSNGLQILSDAGILSTLALPRVSEATGALSRLASAGSGTYVLSNEGRVYRHQGIWLEHHASGIAAANSIAVAPDGALLVTDQQSSALSRIANGQIELIAFFYEEPWGVCVLNDHQFIVASRAHSYVTGLDGMSSTTSLGYIQPTGMRCESSGTILIADESSNRIRRLQLGVTPAPPAIGSIVHSSIRSFTAMERNAQQSLVLGTWTPEHGGDYALSLTPLSNEVQGTISTGLHVGPAASSLMGVTPARVIPTAAEVHVSTAIKGADFTRLARIEPGQTTQLGNFVGNPSAFGVTPAGGYWYTSSTLHHAPAVDAPAQQIGNDHHRMGGEVPVDALGRAYVITTGNQLVRVAPDGTRSVIASVNSTAIGLTIDPENNLYVLQSDRVTRIAADGSASLYAMLPSGFISHGITRNGAGTLYVQGLQNKLLRISADRSVTPIVRSIGFEYESGSINIAGDCADSLLITPIDMPSLGQVGEEFTIAQLLGTTGELGLVMNGKLVSQNLIDMDRIVYDRFSSALIVWDHSSSKLFRLPITCGAIDIEYHVVAAAGETLTALEPPATQQIAMPDGSTEYVWSLREVNALGTGISFNTTLTNLQRGEDRPVAREAFLRLTNSFQPGDLRVPVQIPTVHVDDLVAIDVGTDAATYAPFTPVDIDLSLTNTDAFSKQARLLVRVLDGDTNLVTTLIDRQQVLGGNEQIELDPPFNTEDRAPGSFRVLAEMRADDDSVLASAEASFSITAGSGAGPSVASTVDTTLAQYTTGDTAIILATVQNLLGNRALTNLVLNDRVVSSGGVEVFAVTTPIASIAAAGEQRLQFPFSLDGVAAGIYDVLQEVRDANGVLLDGRGAQFEVLALAGPETLTGTLQLSAARLRRGTPLQLDAEIRNRGSLGATGVEFSLQVVHPQTGSVVATFEATRDLAAGAIDTLSHTLNTSTLGLRDFVAVLRARIGSETRVLDQRPFLIEGVDLAGTLVVTPSDLRRGDDVTLTTNLRNNGNIAAADIVLDLRIENATTGSPVNSWQYTQPALAVNGNVEHAEIQDTQPLPIGTYRAFLTTTFEGSTATIGQADFIVRDIIASGTIQVDPQSGQSGTPFGIDAAVLNSGNLTTGAMPVRIDVLRTDTQVEQATWTESITLGEGQLQHVVREFVSDTTAAGEYQAVVSAQVEGIWIEFARAPFTVARTPADVDLRLEVPRDARVLVLMSCSIEQAAAQALDAPNVPNAVATTCEGFKDGFEGIAAGPSTDQCEAERREFLTGYFEARGISHKIVQTQSEFMRELRCGRHNLYWLSGGASRLDEAATKELREVVYRGDGLIHDGNNQERNLRVDEMLGVGYVEPIATPDLVHHGAGTLFPAVDLPTYGHSLRYTLTSGQVESSFPTASAPAIVSNSYGQGRTLAYAFDLIASLQRDGAQPAVERLIENALVHAAPTVATADFAVGAYVPVTAVLENQGASADLRVQLQALSPALVESSSPTPQSTNALGAIWDLSMQPADTRSFDVNLRLPREDVDTSIDAHMSQRFGSSLEPLSNRSISLNIADADAARLALVASLQAATLTPTEQAARTRALAAISAADGFMQSGQAESAAAKWVEAANEVTTIASVSHSAWRLAIARLLEHAQRKACRVGAALCGTSTATPVRFDDATFAPLNGNAPSLFAQGGDIADWEWSLAADARAPTASHIDLDWGNQQPVRFVAVFNADGSATLELFNGATSIGSTSYPAGASPIQLGSAMQFVARSAGGISSTTRIRLTGIRINGQAIADEVGTLPSSLLQESVLSLYWPELRQGGTVEGNITLDFAGCWPPGGPTLSIGVRMGGLSCNGGVQ